MNCLIPQKVSAMTQRTTRAACAAVLAGAMTATACGGGHDITGASLSEMEPLTLRYADYTSASSAGPFQAFADEVEERSGGVVTFDQFWGGSLLKGADMAQGIRGGVADIGMFTPSYYPSEYPVTDWMTKLGSAVESEYPLGAMQAFGALSDFALNEPAVTEQFEDRGMKLLFTWTPASNYHLACKEPVTSLADAAGKRVRSGGAFNFTEIEAMGMVPVSLPTGEIYEGLQRGVIDCTVVSAKILVSLGIWEVAKHYVEVPLTGYTQFLVMNLDVWDSLPPDAQQAMWDALPTWHEEYLRQESLILEQRKFDEGPEHGVQFHTADDAMVTALRDHQQQVRASLASDAPPGIDDPAAVIDRYRATLTEWRERLGTAGYDEPAPESADPEETALDLAPFRTDMENEVFGPLRPGDDR